MQWGGSGGTRGWSLRLGAASAPRWILRRLRVGAMQRRASRAWRAAGPALRPDPRAVDFDRSLVERDVDEIEPVDAHASAPLRALEQLVDG